MKRLAYLVFALASTGCTSAIATGGGGGTASVSADRMAADIRTVSSDAFLGRGTRNARRGARDELHPRSAPGSRSPARRPERLVVSGSAAQSVGHRRRAVAVGQRQRPDDSLKQGEQIAVRASMQNVDRVNIQNAPIVFLGYGVRAPERNWDDFKGENLRGKVGIVLINDPDFETGQGDFGGKAMTYYGRWTYKYEEAARQGLAGLLDRTRDRARLLRLGDREELEHEHDVRHRARQPRRGASAARGMGSARRRGSAVQRRRPGFRGAEAARADARVPARHARQRDLLGELSGEAADDSLEERARPPAGNDARRTRRFSTARTGIISASARLMRAATAFTTARWTTAPESPRSSSSRACSQRAAAAALARVRVLDGRGEGSARLGVLREQSGISARDDSCRLQHRRACSPTGRARDVLVVGSGQTDIEDRLQAVLAANNRVMTPDATPEAGYFFRSDHFPMAKRGVPMLYMDSGIDLLAGGIAAGSAFDDGVSARRVPSAGRRIRSGHLESRGNRGGCRGAAPAGTCSSPIRAIGRTTERHRSSVRCGTRARQAGSVKR